MITNVAQFYQKLHPEAMESLDGVVVPKPKWKLEEEKQRLLQKVN